MKILSFIDHFQTNRSLICILTKKIYLEICLKLLLITIINIFTTLYVLLII